MHVGAGNAVRVVMPGLDYHQSQVWRATVDDQGLDVLPPLIEAAKVEVGRAEFRHRPCIAFALRPDHAADTTMHGSDPRDRRGPRLRAGARVQMVTQAWQRAVLKPA